MAEYGDKESSSQTEKRFSTAAEDSVDGIIYDFDPQSNFVECVDESINVSLEAPPESEYVQLLWLTFDLMIFT